MARYSQAYLSKSPTRASVGHGNISSSRLDWVQEAGTWAMFYYETKGVLNVGMRAYPFDWGSVSIIPPGYRCGHDKVSEGTECRWHNFDLPGFSQDAMAMPVMSHLSPERFKLLLKGYDEMIVTIDRTHTRATACIWNVLWTFAQPLDVMRSSMHLFQAEDHIRKNLHDHLRVDAIAAKVGVSQTHLLRLFRMQHGATVQQFIRDLRVNEARRMLTTTSLSIKEIAYQVGFTDIQHFNKVMRWMTGYSPTRLRAGTSIGMDDDKESKELQ